MTSPSLAGSFSIEPGLLALVVDVVLVFLLRHAGVDGPEDVVVLVDDEGSSSLANSNFSSSSSHVPEPAISSELEDSRLLSSDEDGTLRASTNIVGGLRLVELPGASSIGGVLVDSSLVVDNPDALGSNSNSDSMSRELVPLASLLVLVDSHGGGSDEDFTVGSSSHILGFDARGESDLLPVDTVPSEEVTIGCNDPWSAIRLNTDSGSSLRANLRPALAIPSEGHSVGSDNPNGIIGTNSDVLGSSGSSSPLNGLEGVASLGVVLSGDGGSCHLFVADGGDRAADSSSLGGHESLGVGLLLSSSISAQYFLVLGI